MQDRRLPTAGGVALVLLTVAGLTGCAAHRSYDLVDAQQLQDASCYKYWQAKLPVRNGDAVDRCYLLDDNLYVTTEGGDIFAVHAHHGLLRWGTKLTERDFTIFPPRHLRSADGQGPVALLTTTQLLILDRYSGDVLLNTTPPCPPGTSVIGDKNRLFMGSSDGHVYAYYWNHRFGSEPLQSWRMSAGAPVVASPALYGGDDLFFATQLGKVVRCGADDKAYGWVASLGDRVTIDPVVDDSGVYVACANRSLYRLDRSTGQVLWRQRFAGVLTQPPIVVRQVCYQTSEKEGLVAVDVATGARLWERADIVAYVGTAPGEVVVRTSANDIAVLDTDTGRTLRSFPMGEATVVAVNPKDDTVYLIAPDGRIESVKPEGVPYLRRQEVAAARAMLGRAPVTHQPAKRVKKVTRRRQDADPLRSSLDRGTD